MMATFSLMLLIWSGCHIVIKGFRGQSIHHLYFTSFAVGCGGFFYFHILGV